MKKPLKILTTTLLLSPLVLACFTLSQMAQAEPDVSPPPDGGYPGFTTAEGQNALKNLTSGFGNSAFGWYSLFSVQVPATILALARNPGAQHCAGKYCQRRRGAHPEHQRYKEHFQWSGGNGLEQCRQRQYRCRLLFALQQ